MKETWSYDRTKRFGKNGTRWHFVSCYFDDTAIDYDSRPYELYFRNDEKTEFGLLRYESKKDNPYRDYDALISKIMNNVPFRKTLLNPETKDIWRKDWK